MNRAIILLIMQIGEDYPELSGYLNEMTVTIPDQKNPTITISSLRKYYGSLQSMVNTFACSHPIY